MTIKERVSQILHMMKGGIEDPDVTESRLQTNEMNHRVEVSEQILRDVQKSLDFKRTGFLLADASNFDLAKMIDEAAKGDR